MAGTGVLLLGFLLVHMIGNLVILKGPDALNAYAAWMQGHPLLWVFRGGLAALFAVHVIAAITLARGNRAAGSAPYRHPAWPRGRLVGRWMLVTGLLLLAFLVFHILHLTVGAVGPDLAGLVDHQGRTHVHARITTSFNDPTLAGIYLIAVLMLGLHLWHAVESLFQTLGFNHESYQGILRFIAPALTFAVCAGFAAVPLLVLTDSLPAGTTP